MAQILIETERRQVPAESLDGQTLLDMLRQEGFQIAAPCGGQGKCGKCLVTLRDAAGERQVLACRTVAAEACTVSFQEQDGGAILTAADGGIASVTPGREGLGAAVDLGTTTVVLELLDLADGSSRGLRSTWNVQAPYGADVITRIQYCMDHPEGLQTLQTAIRGQLRELLKDLGCGPEDVKETFVAGNTVMQHLFAGLDARSIALAPFTPQTLFAEDHQDEGGLRYAPCVAGYVGGDITAGLLSSGLYARPERSLFLDIGTNGEMALGGAEGFLCCAVASGPAFEGAGIACGMAGTDGAVSHVRWDGEEPELEVIGGGTPRGLCGSGLIDLLAVLTRRRIISAYGLLQGPDEAPEGYERWLGEDDNGNGIFYLTADHSVYLTAGDVRQLQLAKAAVAAGISVLLKKAGLRVEDLDRLYLAGGFGTYMDAKSAAAIGMLPEALAGKTVLLGNASLAGARLALLDETKRGTLREIRRSCRYLELSGDPDFNREYPEQMLFYEEDDEEWN
ncbi:MAG: DUF4445 domain-containing protein [Oscillospiraceae bacterium]|nr:DUF4445 domain-containing protein [Oscillospiraceae bacterium]